MRDGHPRVSIGLPVYNGEVYLSGALDTLLGQTFTDLELIISDNASTDRTPEICRSYAARDHRVRYIRHEVNRGVPWNHNFALGQATGEYFRWASHDDLCAPDFVARCVKELDADPGLVLCHTRTVVLDGEGTVLSHNGGSPWIGSPLAHERFRDLVGLGHRYWQPLLTFGVMRREAAVVAGGLGTHIGGDRTFLARLALQGRFLEVDEDLFFYREHAGQASSPSRGRAARNAWWDPSKSGQIVLPYFRLGFEYARLVRNAPISGPERRRCYVVLLRWPFHYWKHLAVDLKHAGEDVAARARTTLRPGGPRPGQGGRAKAHRRTEVGMHFEILRFWDLAPALVHAWDRLAAGRGMHADLYSSHAWLVAWVQAMGAEVAGALRIPAVLGPDRPVALLPLIARSPRRWEWAGRGGSRMRYRPVLAAEQPPAEALGLLVEGIARAGVDDLALHRLPARDPATDGLVAALRQAGFHTSRRRTSSDCLAVVSGGWDEHRRRLAGYERQVKRLVKRLVPLWEVSVDEYGPATGAPVLDGFEAYAAVYDRSWKRPMPPPMHTLERELVRRTASLGWPRVYVLRLDGQPAAAEVWFRLGQVATSLGTAYDQRMAALGPGSIIAWWAQERLFAEAVPGLIDHLPGYGPQKDQLGPDRSPIVEVEAARRTVVSGVTFPVRRQVRYVAPRVAGRVRRRVGRLGRQAAAARWRRAGPARAVEIAPGPRPLPAEPLGLDQATRRFLAVAGGHPNPTAMTRDWHQADTWWRVGAEPVALVRLGSPGDRRAVREVVLLRDDCAPLTEVLAGLGAALGTPLAADLPAGHAHRGSHTNRPPIAVQRAALDWPRQGLSSPA